MGWGALAAAVVGGVSSYVSSNKASKNQSVPSDTYNAYGQVNTPNQGAITSRDSIYSTLNSKPFQGQVQGANNTYINALNSTANGASGQAIENYGNDVLSGKYLNSPQVNDYATAAGNQINARAADNQARLASSYARAGMGFSTGQLQALQGARTSAAAQAATTRAGLIADNYKNERALQQTAPALIQGAQQQRLQNLGAAEGAYYSPLQQQASITTGLLGNQQVQAPTLIQQPNGAAAAANGINSAASIYNAYKSFSNNNNNQGSIDSVDENGP